jgi:hypothetical protein
MKKEFPSLFVFTAIALCVVFVYALFRIGVDVNGLFDLRRVELSSAFRFLMDNKIAVMIALAVVVVAKLMAGAPGPVKS